VGDGVGYAVGAAVGPWGNAGGKVGEAWGMLEGGRGIEPLPTGVGSKVGSAVGEDVGAAVGLWRRQRKIKLRGHSDSGLWVISTHRRGLLRGRGRRLLSRRRRGQLSPEFTSQHRRSRIFTIDPQPHTGVGSRVGAAVG
jgi:hypothetical protein